MLQGRVVSRSFNRADLVEQLYLFVVATGFCQSFQLVTNMPRHVYRDRAQSLHGAGLDDGVALLVEVTDEADIANQTSATVQKEMWASYCEMVTRASVPERVRQHGVYHVVSSQRDPGPPLLGLYITR